MYVPTNFTLFCMLCKPLKKYAKSGNMAKCRIQIFVQLAGILMLVMGSLKVFVYIDRCFFLMALQVDFFLLLFFISVFRPTISLKDSWLLGIKWLHLLSFCSCVLRSSSRLWAEFAAHSWSLLVRTPSSPAKQRTSLSKFRVFLPMQVSYQPLFVLLKIFYNIFYNISHNPTKLYLLLFWESG